MPKNPIPLYPALLLFLFLFRLTEARAEATGFPMDSTRISTSAQAMAWLDSLQVVGPSAFWKNVEPAVFYENLKGFAISPLKFYEGRSNNFCAYSALTYLPLRYDPLGFCQFMYTLYLKGEAVFNGVRFSPSAPVREEAGLLLYKGALDLNPAAQMWFLSLADKFKGYLNFFNRGFDKGDENTLWASTNYAKFNRMLRRVCDLKVRARGSDLIRPWIGDRYSYIRDKLNKGTVFLYLNNRLLYRKKHTAGRLSIPTHYILLMDIEKVADDKINIIYWDYGLKSLQQVTPRLLKKIIFGISYAFPEL